MKMIDDPHKRFQPICEKVNRTYDINKRVKVAKHIEKNYIYIFLTYIYTRIYIQYMYKYIGSIYTKIKWFNFPLLAIRNIKI